MKGQLRFFMSSADEAEFVAFARDLVDNLDKESDTQWFFCVGGCRIQLLRCKQHSDILTVGRLALGTELELDDHVAETAKRAEKTFNKMRRWLKKTYANNATARNINIDRSTAPCPSLWIGPDVLRMLRSGDSLTLAQSRSGIVVYELNAA